MTSDAQGGSVVPENPDTSDFLVVGLGASAGGLEALEQLFDNTPDDCGLAFVIITHTPSGRVSLMPELLGRHTGMPIVVVESDTPVAPGRVYLGAPGVPLSIEGGVLHPVPCEGGRRELPIDLFFRSLARDRREWGAGVVLSGTGTDGTQGLKEIKAASGLTLAQEELSARYAGMPHSAIAALQVDHVLPPSQMTQRLVSYARSVARQPRGLPAPETEAPELYARIFLLLRSRTGHDFSYYKTTTIRRRIERRMNVHMLETVRDYLRFLHANPQELDRLFNELLIGVTSFFRDSAAFGILGDLAIPELIADKPSDYVVRAWVPGCSTGEEAYSIAILLAEAIERTRARVTAQVFATDLDSESIEFARAGVFPESIAADVSPARLERYFSRDGITHRIRKEVREMLVFAPQNLIEDPPFTRLDLVSCRNLLIYLDAKLQQRLIPVFHYTLRPGGLLFLGTSETVGAFGQLFEPLDKKSKIYRRKEVAVAGYPTEPPASPVRAGLGAPGRELPAAPGQRRSVEMSTAHMAERAILQHLAPPTVLMHERGEIVHIHGRTGLFLEPSPGPQATANIYNMAREGLQVDLAMAVRHAGATEEDVLHRGVRVRSNGHHVTVDLRVKRLVYPETLRGLFLVAFERAEQLAQTTGPELAPLVNAAPELAERTSSLERELQHAREVHQSTVEELETANEELKSTNEELQSTNEELQSANEEMETSKEEMQSLNEELQTVNAELQGKVEELSRVNDDMKNLLNATDIATLFLDNDLRIKRYTDQAKHVIRLIQSDVGRHIGDLVPKLRYTRIVEDSTEVLRTLVHKEAEVQSEDGTWYLMRILPYRTTDNVIDGLVATFVEMSKLKGLQRENQRVLDALRSASTCAFGQDSDGRYQWVSGSLFGRQPEQLVGYLGQELFAPQDADALEDARREATQQARLVHRTMQMSIGGHRRAFAVFLAPAGGNGDGRSVHGVVIPSEETVAGRS